MSQSSQGSDPLVPSDGGENARPIARRPHGALGPLGPDAGDPLDGYPLDEQDQPSPYSPGRLWRYKWSILIVALLVAGIASAAIWTLLEPMYTVRAEIRVRPIIPRLVFATDDNGAIPFYQSFLNTQVSVLRSPTVLRRVLDEPAVQQTQWYRDEQARRESLGPPPAERLLAVMTAMPRPKTEVIDVAFETRHPLDGATIVNAMLDHYILYSQEISDETRDMLYRKLVEEAEALENEIAGREQRAAGLRRELGSNVPEELVAARRVRLDETQAQLGIVRRQIALLDWQVGELDKLLVPAKENGDAAPADAEAQTASYQGDPEWQRLNLELRNARYQYDVDSANLGDSHPRQVELRKRIEFLTSLLAERQQLLDGQWAAVPGSIGQAGAPSLPLKLQELRSQLALAQKERELLEAEVDRELDGWLRTFDSAETLARENTQIARKREVYDAVQSRLEQKRMERNVPGAIDVLSRAVPPIKASSDRRILFTALAVLLGLSLGVGQALLRSSGNETIFEAEDISPDWRLPMLGQIPLLAGETARSSLDEDPVLKECIRMVRTALLQRAGGPEGFAVLITSADPGTGKTSVSLMLARSLARCGKKVLLVDADVRTASLSRQFGLEGEPGLLAALSAGGKGNGAVGIDVGQGEFRLLPAGRIESDGQMELIANGAFSRCLQRWRQQYDIVLLDSPPVLATADAQILAQQADGTVMVVREGHSRRGEVFGAMAQLSTAGERFWGTVFIGSNSRRPSYRYRYGYNYGYGGQG